MLSQRTLRLTTALLLSSVGANVAASTLGVNADMERLDREMKTLREEEHFDRMFNGVIYGSLGTWFGIMTLQQDNGFARAIVGVPTALFLGASAVNFLDESSVESTASAYLNSPRATEAERRSRVQLGETSLREVAESAKRSRLIAAGVWGALGFATVIAGANGDNKSAFDDAVNGAVILLGSIFVGIGFANAFFTSHAEDSYEAYRRGSESRVSKVDWNFRWSPQPDAPLSASLNLRF